MRKQVWCRRAENYNTCRPFSPEGDSNWQNLEVMYCTIKLYYWARPLPFTVSLSTWKGNIILPMVVWALWYCHQIQQPTPHPLNATNFGDCFVEVEVCIVWYLSWLVDDGVDSAALCPASVQLWGRCQSSVITSNYKEVIWLGRLIWKNMKEVERVRAAKK